MAARGHEFTPDEIDRALTALALNGRSAPRAREQLQEDTSLTRLPSERVLYLWRDKYADRLQEIETQRAPQIEAAAIQTYRAIVARTAQVQLQAVERAAHGLDDLDATGASTVARNLAVSGGVAADKLLVFTDRPNQITERRDPGEIMRQLDSILGTAQEIEDATERPLLQESADTNARELEPG